MTPLASALSAVPLSVVNINFLNSNYVFNWILYLYFDVLSGHLLELMTNPIDFRTTISINKRILIFV